MRNPQFNFKHGLWDHPLYTTWKGMMGRCYRPKTNGYHNYGGRGIKVCERWHDVRNFVLDTGERPNGYQLDRINNNSDYEPNNCKWSSRLEQTFNVRPKQSNSSTDMKGITYNPRIGEKTTKYIVYKQINKKRVYLGGFETFDEAKNVLECYIEEQMKYLINQKEQANE